MTSTIAWLDYSEGDRRRMREVIELFREHDTRDELGIGSVRDAFSEMLFPGTSTIQTRPRYLLLVPWAFRRLERDRIASAHAATVSRRHEVQTINALLASGETDGVLGRVAGASLQRLPSEVYWSGLASYGIRRFSGSIGDYHRSLDAFHRRATAERRAESDELYERTMANWDPSLPAEPPGLWETTTLDLLPVEAEYLRDRIVTSHPGSMLAQLLTGKRLASNLAAPWLYPGDLTDATRRILHHARHFSDVMHGAALLYNLELARASARFGIERDRNLVLEYSDRSREWREGIDDQEVRAWDRLDLWALVRRSNPALSYPTEAFVNRWIDLTQAGRTSGDEAVALVHERERRMKGGQARLTSHRQLEMWSGAAGTGRLDYRWPTARTLVRDVQAGLRDA